MLRILCVVNCQYPYFLLCFVFSTLPIIPWFCVFSTLSHMFWITHTSPGVAYSLHFHLCFELPTLPLVLRILYRFTCVLNTHNFPSVAYSLHFHLCFELPIIPLVLPILYNFTCVLYYPYFPWSYSRILYNFTFVWITRTSSGVAYSQHFQLCFELPIRPLVLRILYTFTVVLDNQYVPWCCEFYVLWIASTHTSSCVAYSLHYPSSPGFAYSQHFQLCFE